MKIIRVILLAVLFCGSMHADLITFSMRWGGVVAVAETSAFYYRYYVLDNARTMVDTNVLHYQIKEYHWPDDTLYNGSWSHSQSLLYSRSNCDDENFYPMWMPNGYLPAQGDTNICLFEYDSAAGTPDHKGFYAVITSKQDVTYSGDSVRFCSLRVVANIDTSHVDIYPQLTWQKAKYDTATWDPITLNYNPIMGYCVYRSASGFDGWERLVPNGGGIYNLWDDTTHIDSTVPAGSYYYAIRLLYAPTLRIIGSDTLWILSKLSKNSYSTGAIGVAEQGSNKAPSRLQIYPNPSGGEVKLRCSAVAGQGDAYIRIYDSSGQLVRSMRMPSYDMTWKCDDKEGKALPAGVYIIELHAGNDVLTEKLILQR